MTKHLATPSWPRLTETQYYAQPRNAARGQRVKVHILDLAPERYEGDKRYEALCSAIPQSGFRKVDATAMGGIPLYKDPNDLCPTCGKKAAR